MAEEEIVSVIKELLSERPELKRVFLDTLDKQTEEGVNGEKQTPLLSLDSHTTSSLPGSGFTESQNRPLGRRIASNPALSLPVWEVPAYWSKVFLFVFNVIMLTTVGIAYYMSIGSRRVSREDFYISSSIDTGWSHRIGAYGISIAFISFIFVMITRYVGIKAIVVEPFEPLIARRVHRLNKSALCFGLLGSFGALGVGAFNYSFNYGVHYFFAYGTFGSAITQIWIQSWIDDLISQHSSFGQPTVKKRWRICRRLQCLVGLLGLAGMFFFGFNGFVEFSCMCELVMAFAIFSYYTSWVCSAGTGYTVGVDLYVRFPREANGH